MSQRLLRAKKLVGKGFCPTILTVCTVSVTPLSKSSQSSKYSSTNKHKHIHKVKSFPHYSTTGPNFG